MFHNLRKICSRYPVTSAYIAIAVGLFLAVQVYRIQNGIQANSAFDSALWKTGAVQPLVFVYDHPLVKEDEFPTSGPYDLWAGQWWRILVSGFHHGDLFHLFLNSIVIGFLGRLIEPRLRWWLYAAFLLFATFISLLPEYYFEHYPVGLSGGAYAMFGLLILMRKTDPELAEVFTEREITWGITWLLLCFVLTHFGFMSIANAAHVAGFLYGLLAGVVLINQSAYARLMRVAFVLAQLLVIPATYLVVHPYWNGKYYWYLARLEDDPAQRIEYLKQGMALSPGEPKISAELALSLYRAGETPFRPWEIMLQSLKQNRSYDKGVDITRLFWKQFRSEEQKQQALDIAADVFGDEADAWMERLQLDQEEVAQADVPLPDSGNLPGSEFLFLKETGSPLKPMRPRDLSAPPVDPGSPQSAAEGVTL